MLAVGPTSTPLAIDGKGNDSPWTSAMVLDPFYVGDDSERASVPTAAHLLWDSQNLYIYFRCKEPILGERRNRPDDFRREIQDEDAEVCQDQSVAVLLARPGGEIV